MNKKRLATGLKFLLVAAVIFGWYRLRPYMDPYIVRDWVLSFGKLAEVFYTLAWVFLPVFIFPVIALIIPGGMIFGLWKGLLLTGIGVFFNATIMFFLTRSVFKETIKSYIYPKLPEKIKDKFYMKDQKSLWMFFALLRFLPAISYNLLNYTAGLTEIKYKTHISATLIGCLPGALMYLNIGDKILEPGSFEFFLSLILMGLMILLSLVVAKKFIPSGYQDEE